MRKALFAGSFDPVTLGHVDLIERGCALFDELVVAIGHNPAKRYLFDLSEREALMRASIAHTPARVVAFEGLLVEAAKRHGASVILRGVRSAGDVELESRYGLANRDLTGIETLFLLADPRHIFLSSSLVKEIALNGGDVAAYVPPAVLKALEGVAPASP
ncbi:MAG: pantetheine-phosphate adenylyltransferase [Myxococcales bacterium]|nr:pantetheine-phosphate adenylyltransferase [Myxococcales bacterium]